MKITSSLYRVLWGLGTEPRRLYDICQRAGVSYFTALGALRILQGAHWAAGSRRYSLTGRGSRAREWVLPGMTIRLDAHDDY